MECPLRRFSRGWAEGVVGSAAGGSSAGGLPAGGSSVVDGPAGACATTAGGSTAWLGSLDAIGTTTLGSERTARYVLRVSGRVQDECEDMHAHNVSHDSRARKTSDFGVTVDASCARFWAKPSRVMLRHNKERLML